uniref:Uncharacterized protein n=1 Tax=Romanomermis culicivorax TaxID=13658 RepID=A0A915IY42_ROMCU
MVKKVEKKDQAQAQPDGNQGQVKQRENNHEKGNAQMSLEDQMGTPNKGRWGQDLDGTKYGSIENQKLKTNQGFPKLEIDLLSTR